LTGCKQPARSVVRLLVIGRRDREECALATAHGLLFGDAMLRRRTKAPIPRRSTWRTTEERHAAATPLSHLLSRSGVPTVVTDMDGHVLWLNRGAEELFAGHPGSARPRRCYDLVGGSDPFGNRFCHENCSLVAMSRRGEAIQAFELVVGTSPPRQRPHSVTVLEVPRPRDREPALVHFFHPLDREEQLVRGLEWLAGSRAGGEAAPPRPGEVTRPPLTSRQAEVLQWVAAGLQNKEIAVRLGISLATVRNHVNGILQALGVHSKLEAVALAFFKGWVAPAHMTAVHQPR